MMPAATRNAPDRTARFGFAFIGVLLIAVNLRVSFVSVGPVLGNISSDLELSSAAAGFLTGLPLIAFAVFSPLAPGFASRLGLDRALWMSLLILASGIVLRSLPVARRHLGGNRTDRLGYRVSQCPGALPRKAGLSDAGQPGHRKLHRHAGRLRRDRGSRRRSRGTNVPGGMAACPWNLGGTGSHRHGGAPAVAAPAQVRRPRTPPGRRFPSGRPGPQPWAGR